MCVIDENDTSETSRRSLNPDEINKKIEELKNRKEIYESYKKKLKRESLKDR